MILTSLLCADPGEQQSKLVTPLVGRHCVRVVQASLKFSRVGSNHFTSAPLFCLALASQRPRILGLWTTALALQPSSAKSLQAIIKDGAE